MIAKSSLASSRRIPLLFLVNGIIATIVHFSVLLVIFGVMRLGSAGAASLIASAVSSLVSFLGNKYFVFKIHRDSVVLQASRFTALYLMVAFFHGGFLLTWTDWFDWNYKVGFLVAVCFQVGIGYFGNKYYVFRK